MKNGPELWDAILRGLNDASAVIAGGCVRDYLLGREPKDIDVFVNVACKDQLRVLGRALPATFSVSLMRELTEYEVAPDWVGEVSGVLDGSFCPEGSHDIFDDYTQVQIIGRPSADFGGAQLVSRFDFGITRSWYDGELHDTPEAAQDRANRTVTLMRWDTDDHVRSSLKRFERWRDRYSEPFRLVLPDHLT